MTGNIFNRRTQPAGPRGALEATVARLEQHSSSSRLGAPPVAVANTELAKRAPSAQRVNELLAPFKGKSVGECYRGPGWVDDDGLAWVILVTRDTAWVRAARRLQALAVITWRWNDVPSIPMSLSALIPGQKLDGPGPRWFGPSAEPVVTAIRGTGRFMVLLAEPGGVTGTWLLAEFDPVAKSGLTALERQFAMIPTPGIHGSVRGIRYDTKGRAAVKNRNDEIALWAEPRGDFWATLDNNGPWTPDLQHVDRLQAKWGDRLLRARVQAAAAIELLRDRFNLDGEQPYFNADGTPTSRLSGGTCERLQKAAKEYPHWAKLAAAVAGPAPDAKNAYEAAIACISEPHNCWGLVSVGFDIFRTSWTSTLCRP